MPKLLSPTELERSSTVANSLMNRERLCTGGNSYTRDLSLNPIDFIKERLTTEARVTWLDPCCGTGRALIEAARTVAIETRITILGIDLVPMFDPVPPDLKFVRLKQSSVMNFVHEESFDLITCVHGLHYIGDKLGMIERACSWLKPDGLFVANLDLDNLKIDLEGNSKLRLRKDFRSAGIEFNPRKRLVLCRGWKQIKFGYEYLGADDKAGPNYTGQPAVNSYYKLEA